MPGLVWIIEALEGWGLTRIAAWLSSLFRSKPRVNSADAFCAVLASKITLSLLQQAII
jgi:hypothetical protein